jgi:hypothetical protein
VIQGDDVGIGEVVGGSEEAVKMIFHGTVKKRPQPPDDQDQPGGQAIRYPAEGSVHEETIIKENHCAAVLKIANEFPGVNTETSFRIAAWTFRERYRFMQRIAHTSRFRERKGPCELPYKR